MSIGERIKQAGSLVKIVIGIVALFPVAAVLVGLVAIPPSLSLMVNAIAFSTSAVVVFAVILLDEWIVRLSNRRAAIGAILAVVLGAISLKYYYEFAVRHVVQIEGPAEAQKIFIAPLRPSPAILRIVDPETPGRPTAIEYQWALQGSAEPARLKQLMKEEDGWTTTVMILLLVLAEILLIAPVVALAWKLAGAPATAPPPPDAATSDPGP